MSEFGTQYTQSYAYDLAKDVVSTGEVYDVDAIDQCVENIIATIFGERLFFPEFGSGLSFALFENVDERNGELLLDSIIENITAWEKRITIDTQNCKLKIDGNNNALTLIVPYYINKNKIKNTFERRIRF
jgi:phage baseplate assembly protein W